MESFPKLYRRIVFLLAHPVDHVVRRRLDIRLGILLGFAQMNRSAIVTADFVFRQHNLTILGDLRSLEPNFQVVDFDELRFETHGGVVPRLRGGLGVIALAKVAKDNGGKRVCLLMMNKPCSYKTHRRIRRAESK
jgi:hypothetical protein